MTGVPETSPSARPVQPGPFFSVLIPTFNRPRYLAEAVASVLAGTLDDFELVISDNCSPDREAVRSALAPFLGDPRVSVAYQASNLGEPGNRHYLMRRAAGRYRIILGDDDLLAKDALARLRQAIEADPGYDFYLFGFSLIDEKGAVYETRRALEPLVLSREDLAMTRDLLCADLHPFWFYHPATFCFPAALHEEIEPNRNIGMGDDLMFLFDAVIAGKRARVVPHALFSYRKAMGAGAYGGQGNLSKERWANVATRRMIYYELLGREGLPPAIAEFVHSDEFLRRFLYNVIVIDPEVGAGDLERLELRPRELAGLRRHWRRWRRPSFERWLRVGRVARFSRYFGLAGLRESWRVGRQRRAYERNRAASR